MAQQPAVIFVARHGARLDAADSSWHLSTPSPYDPPITYGGWNQCRSLGTRIASLLHAREEGYDKDRSSAGAADEAPDAPPRKRRRLKHRVIIHTSPFLRCLQTSVAIAAGIAQYNPSVDAGSARRRPSSASPRLRTAEGSGTVRSVSSIAEPKYDFAHAIARKALHEKRHRTSQLRVDAFLGEWLNPQYYEGITAPPPSAMMVATAKAELMENETVEFFRPTVTTTASANNNLWAGANRARPGSRESPLENASPVDEPTPPASPTRSRANTQNSPIGNESGRKSPFRPGSPLLPLTSTLPRHETSIYNPPTPQYAVSASHKIPQGYVTHARNACTIVDYQWDSSRPPLDWGDGGEYGEEWSHIHKRIRKGLNCLVQWYSQREASDKVDDLIRLEQAEEGDEDDVQEDVVVVLVTHGAGCNALIGALTGQPVLLDVGMASLTMAVRKDDAPPVNVDSYFSPTASTSTNSSAPRNGLVRRGSVDSGLSAIYEMKVVASTEHLRPGANLRKAANPTGTPPDFSSTSRDTLPWLKDRSESGRSNVNSSLGSIRRPSATPVNALSNDPRSGMASAGADRSSSSPKVSAGLWTPPAGRTPVLRPQLQPQQQSQGSASHSYLPLTHSERAKFPTPNDGMTLDSSNSATAPRSPLARVEEKPTSNPTVQTTTTEDGDAAAGADDANESNEFLRPEYAIPPEWSRKMSQQGLWGSRPSGDQIERLVREPKRRWTVEQDS